MSRGGEVGIDDLHWQILDFWFAAHLTSAVATRPQAVIEPK